MGSENSNRSPLSRRRFVRGLGATGLAVGIAGCGGQSAIEDESPTPGDGGSPQPTATPIEVDSAALRKTQELAYVTNQTLPVLPLQEKLAQSFQTTDSWDVPPKDDPTLQRYWPTEWLPRMGEWTAKQSSDDDRLTLGQWAVPQDSQYNPWNGKNFAEPRRMLFDRLLSYNLAEQAYSAYVLSEWSIEGTTATLTVREGQTWHNGDAVTATDVANQLKLDIYNGGSLGRFVAPEDKGMVSERITASDETTVEVSLAEPVTEAVFLAYVQPKYLVAHDGTYGDHVAALDEAGSEDERSSALADLTGATTPEPVGNGPFRFENADTQRTLLSKYDDHPDAGNIDYPEVEYLYMPSNQKRWNALINEQTDGSATLFMPANKVRQLPDSVQVSLIPRHWGLGLVFNFAKAPVDDVRVRKAIAHVVNRESVAKNSGAGTNSKLAVTYPSGLTGEFSGQVEGTWLAGVADEFETYGRGAAQTEKAAALLKDAGYQKQDGTWTKDGEPLRLPIKGPAGFSDWVAGAQTVVSQLTDFGIEAEAVMKDTSTYWGKDYTDGDFVVGLQGWASYNQSYPYFHFQWLYDSWDAKNAWNLPGEFEAPVLHKEERDGTAVEPATLVSELSTASD
jgi:peptide/nickel transport system substrate-binding protein